MQKVRYCLSSNSFNIKFQDLLNPFFIERFGLNLFFSPFVHTTIHYRYQLF